MTNNYLTIALLFLKEAIKINNFSIDQEFDRVEKLLKENLPHIQEEEKESSYNLISVAEMKEETKKINSERKPEHHNSPCRNPTASIFSKDTFNDFTSESSKSKNF